jgi:type I restriction enzyme, S subunit
MYTGIAGVIPYIAIKDVSFYGEIDYGNGVRIPPEAAHKFRSASPDTVLVCAEGGSAGRKIAITDGEVFL